MKKEERKEIFDEMYAALQKAARAIQNYRVNYCLESGINTDVTDNYLKEVEKSADTLKVCVERLREEKKCE